MPDKYCLLHRSVRVSDIIRADDETLFLQDTETPTKRLPFVSVLELQENGRLVEFADNIPLRQATLIVAALNFYNDHKCEMRGF